MPTYPSLSGLSLSPGRDAQDLPWQVAGGQLNARVPLCEGGHDIGRWNETEVLGLARYQNA